MREKHVDREQWREEGMTAGRENTDVVVVVVNRGVGEMRRRERERERNSKTNPLLSKKKDRERRVGRTTIPIVTDHSTCRELFSSVTSSRFPLRASEGE